METFRHNADYGVRVPPTSQKASVPHAPPPYQPPQSNLVLTQGAVPAFQVTSTVVTSLPVYEPDYLHVSLINILWFCPVLGLAALIFSVKTRQCNRRGDIAGAKENSRNALILNRSGLVVGLCITLGWVIYVIVYLAKIRYS